MTQTWPSYPTAELKQIIAYREQYTKGDSVTRSMRAEIDRREKVA